MIDHHYLLLFCGAFSPSTPVFRVQFRDSNAILENTVEELLAAAEARRELMRKIQQENVLLSNKLDRFNRQFAEIRLQDAVASPPPPYATPLLLAVR